MIVLLMAFLVLVLTAAIIVAVAACAHLRQSVADVRMRLGAYLPATIIESVLARADMKPMAKYYQSATVAVMRINNFDSLIERLSPHAALRYINECHLLCGSAVHRNGGVIERFLEDGLVAIFGIDETSGNDHEYRAIRAGLEAARLVASMKPRWESDGRRAFRIATGVHTGNYIAGDVGFGEQRSFAIVGHGVVVAHRLQRLSEELHASVLTSGITYAKVRERFVAMPIKHVPIHHGSAGNDAYIVRSLAMGELVEELGLPTTPILATYITDEADFFNSATKPRQASILQRLYARPVPPRVVDMGGKDEPIMPGNDWLELAEAETLERPLELP